MTRTTLIRTAQLAVITGAVVVSLASMDGDARAHPAPAGGPKPTPPCWEGCHADPTGRIGHPATGHNPKHTHKPPREPRLTQPPTDTED